MLLHGFTLDDAEYCTATRRPMGSFRLLLLRLLFPALIGQSELWQARVTSQCPWQALSTFDNGRLASYGGFHQRCDGAVGAALSHVPKLLMIDLIRGNGSGVLAGDFYSGCRHSQTFSQLRNTPSPLGGKPFSSPELLTSSPGASSASPKPRPRVSFWIPCSIATSSAVYQV